MYLYLIGIIFFQIYLFLLGVLERFEENPKIKKITAVYRKVVGKKDKVHATISKGNMGIW